MTADEFAKDIIEGPAGMNEFEERECAIWADGDRVAAAVWTLKCLANPRCKGSQEAIDAILASRARMTAEGVPA